MSNLQDHQNLHETQRFPGSPHPGRYQCGYALRHRDGAGNSLEYWPAVKHPQQRHWAAATGTENH
jgi:hypothetical protein